MICVGTAYAVLVYYPDTQQTLILLPWIVLEPSLYFVFSLSVNHTAVFIGLCVLLISCLVQVYFVQYMPKGLRRPHYYAFIALFTGAMLGLVIVNNLFWLFLFWSLTGTCSYFLISYRPKAHLSSIASAQALLMSKTGDIGFIFGICILWAFFSTLDIHVLQSLFQSSDIVTVPTVAMYLSIGSLLFVWSAMSKSAQFPFQSWLLRAMIAPTPISALLHSATLVAAGVLLMVRLSFLFTEITYNIVFIIGVATAITASIAALRTSQTKRLLAFSTLAQIGIMFLLIGLEYTLEALLYFIIHAFFKCLLFLSTGAMARYHNPEAPHRPSTLRAICGMRTRTPIAFYTALIGIGAMGGIPWLSGYIIKARTLSALITQSTPLLALGIGLFVLTSLYSARLMAYLLWGHLTYPTERKPCPPMGLINTVLIINALTALEWAYHLPYTTGTWIYKQLASAEFVSSNLWGYNQSTNILSTSPWMLIPLLSFGIGMGYYFYALHPRTKKIFFSRKQYHHINTLLEGQILYVLGEKVLSKGLPLVTFLEQLSGRYLKGFIISFTWSATQGCASIERIHVGQWIMRKMTQGGKYIYLLQKHPLAVHIEQGLLILLIIIIGVLVFF